MNCIVPILTKVEQRSQGRFIPGSPPLPIFLPKSLELEFMDIARQIWGLLLETWFFSQVMNGRSIVDLDTLPLPEALTKELYHQLLQETILYEGLLVVQEKQ